MEERLNFFYHHICHTCKVNSPLVQTCSGCKLVSYCSGDHQRIDWEHHKSICRAVQLFLKERRSRSIFPINHTRTAEEWTRICTNITFHLEISLRRCLKVYEKQMFFFPCMCPVCFLVGKGVIYSCENCNYICYCSPEHQFQDEKNHEEECSKFKLCYEVDKLCFESQFNPMDYNVPYPNGKSFPESMDSFLNMFASIHSGPYKALLSEHLSGSLNLLWTIKSSFYISEKSNLTIHIVGASDYEQSVLMTIELLFHWIPCLNKLSLVLVGPQVCPDYIRPIFCKNCLASKIFTLSIEKKLYHQYVDSGFSIDPDVVFIFNCGFSEFSNSAQNTWSESIKRMWDLKNILLAFTSFTEKEAKEDFSLVKKIKPKGKDLKTVKFVYKNPFRSLRPHRNWDYSGGPFFYNNSYITSIDIKC